MYKWTKHYVADMSTYPYPIPRTVPTYQPRSRTLYHASNLLAHTWSKGGRVLAQTAGGINGRLHLNLVIGLQSPMNTTGRKVTSQYLCTATVETHKEDIVYAPSDIQMMYMYTPPENLMKTPSLIMRIVHVVPRMTRERERERFATHTCTSKFISYTLHFSEPILCLIS